MALKIRLWQQGCANKRSYRVVVADSRSPRDGKFVESIGWYAPCAKAEASQWSLQQERLHYWLSVGAQMTETVASIAKKSASVLTQSPLVEEGARGAQKAAKRGASA